MVIQHHCVYPLTWSSTQTLAYLYKLIGPCLWCPSSLQLLKGKFWNRRVPLDVSPSQPRDSCDGIAYFHLCDGRIRSHPCHGRTHTHHQHTRTHVHSLMDRPWELVKKITVIGFENARGAQGQFYVYLRFATIVSSLITDEGTDAS